MTLPIVRPRAEEAADLAALHIRCWQEAYRGIVPDSILDDTDPGHQIAVWRSAIEDPRRIVLAAYDGGRPVGFIMAGVATEQLFEGIDGHIYALYLAASHYRQGIGRRLLGMTAGNWRDRGGRSLALGVLSANARARHFYDALGGRLVREGTYDWGGHAIPDAIYVFEALDALARLNDGTVHP